jgi:histone H3/H4
MDSDILLPKATVVKAIKERLPEDEELKVAAEASELILECCTALIQILSTTANSISEKNKRSTILPEDILGAAKELGFEKYEPAMAEALKAFKSEAKDKRDVKRSKKQNQNTGMTQEELIEMQNKLFQAAAAKAAGSGV